MKHLYYFMILSFLLGCRPSPEDSAIEDSQAKSEDAMAKRYFDMTPQGDSIMCFTLKNSRGMEMQVLNLGGIIMSLTAPDRTGEFQDVVLGFDSLRPYIQDNPFFGVLVGRYGNRIAKGQFSLDGQTYQLVKNNMGNHLHGGDIGFDGVVWQVKPRNTSLGQALELDYTSVDGEEGYPGNLQVKVTYTLREDDALQIDYEATTDKPTIVNLTQHSYFNLNPRAETILDHELRLYANQYLPVDETLIPLGSLDSVASTPFDFTTSKVIGDRIDQDHLQLQRGGGYDHCWVLAKRPGELQLAAELYEPVTGRVMTVSTTEPGVQFYSGNFLDGTLKGKSGRIYAKRSGLCLETQHFPDSPNQEQFPSVRLDPGQTYRTTTIFKFTSR